MRGAQGWGWWASGALPAACEPPGPGGELPSSQVPLRTQLPPRVRSSPRPFLCCRPPQSPRGGAVVGAAPPTPPGEGGAGAANALCRPGPWNWALPVSPAPLGGFLLQSPGNARSLIYGRLAQLGAQAPLLFRPGMLVRKRFSSLAVVGLEHQESVKSHQYPRSLSLLREPAASSGRSLPAS